MTATPTPIRNFIFQDRRVTVAALAIAALMASAPAAASAHAYPVATMPAVGAVVRMSPSSVSITYDEPVTISTGALEVYDAAGRRVDSGPGRSPDSDTVAVAIARRLPDGTYTVAWRVTSADTHVVHGVFSFSVGAPSNAGGIAAALRARGRTPEGLSAGFALVRFVNLLLALLCGGGAAAMLALRDVDVRARRILLRVLVGCGGLLAVAAVAGLPFEAAEVSGTGLAGGLDATALAAVRHIRFGEVWLIRAWTATAFSLLALSLQIAGTRWRMARGAGLVGIGVVLALTLPAAGHASAAGQVAFLIDAAHVLAAAAWLGGLAFLLAAFWLSPAEQRWPLAVRNLPRFSLLATGSVGVLVVAGIINAYVEVGAWRGLWQSTYGELVLTKIGLALPLLALGAFNNRVALPALRAGAQSAGVRARFLQVASAELVLLAVIVGVSAVLIAQAPAKNEVAQTRTVTAAHAVGPFTAIVEVVPGAVGPNAIDMSVTSPSRRPPAIGEVDLAADHPPQRLPRLNLGVTRLSATRFRVTGASFALAGVWQLQVTVRTGRTEWLARIPIAISAASSS